MKTTIKILLGLFLLAALVSQFINHSQILEMGQFVPEQTNLRSGKDLTFARISLLAITMSFLFFWKGKYTWRPLILSIINLIVIVLLYYSILFPQPSIMYEGIETKPAEGFYLLLVVSILQFLTCSTYLIYLKSRNELPS